MSVPRLVRGEYPAALAALVPEYLPALPPDLFTGQAMLYRRDRADQYKLWSVGWNGRDEGGLVPQEKRNRAAGDWVWRATR